MTIELALSAPPPEECCAPLSAEVLDERDAASLSLQFAALADPVRLRLLSLLAASEEGGVCVCDLVEPAGRSQSTISHHLRVLAEAGLVVGEKRGRNVWYAAVPASLTRLRSVLSPA